MQFNVYLFVCLLLLSQTTWCDILFLWIAFICMVLIMFVMVISLAIFSKFWFDSVMILSCFSIPQPLHFFLSIKRRLFLVRLLLQPIIKFYFIIASFSLNFRFSLLYCFSIFSPFLIFSPTSYGQLSPTQHARSPVFAALIGVLECLVRHENMNYYLTWFTLVLYAGRLYPSVYGFPKWTHWNSGAPAGE